MVKIKIEDGQSIQEYSFPKMIGDDQDEEGLFIFHAGSRGEASGPFVWMEVKDGYFECHDDFDCLVESSTEMSAARKAGLTDDEIREKFSIEREA